MEDKREQFILEAYQGMVSISDLCLAYNISRTAEYYNFIRPHEALQQNTPYPLQGGAKHRTPKER